jgi:hypothetical protein
LISKACTARLPVRKKKGEKEGEKIISDRGSNGQV